MIEYAMNNLRQVLEGSLWEAPWSYVDSKDALGSRMTGNKWNVASKHGPHGEPFFLFLKKEPNVEWKQKRAVECETSR